MSNKIQIIIPMTGNGSRFKAAGYEILKPFIKVHNKPMIEWVVKLFPEDINEIVFICRQEHLDNISYLRSELTRIAPTAKIFSIDNWEKKGPVGDVLRASEVIDDSRPVVISYCDYYMHWDYSGFKSELLNRGCDGAVPCYSGFHPHLIPQKNLYASCKIDEHENLIEIREKFSWNNDKKQTRHSPGVYYFKSGAILKKYCQQMIDANDDINGEFYASLPFNYLVGDGLKVWCPVNVSHFCQWGTPEDLNDYLFWVDMVKGFGR